MAAKTTIHLVRHGKAENPHGIWYGRMEGFPLSRLGVRQAEAAGEYLAQRSVQALYTSPVTRAAQTAAVIGRRLGLRPQIEELIIETTTLLEGRPGDWRLFRNPLNARYFFNPYRPSWGEPYASLRSRMFDAVERMITAHPGGEVVAVSHMTPILIARLHYEGNLKPPWRAKLPCGPASVTTLEFRSGKWAGTTYRTNEVQDLP